MMYIVHAVLLSFSVELRQKQIYNKYKIVRFLIVGYEEDESGMKKFEDEDLRKIVGLVGRS